MLIPDGLAVDICVDLGQIQILSIPGEGIDINPGQINNRHLCQSRVDSHFVDPRGWGLRTVNPHHLRAKHCESPPSPCEVRG